MKTIHVSASPGENRIAVVDRDGTLLDYAIWRPGAPDSVGDVHRARVIAHVPAMAGAFMALPDAEGFLPDSEGAAGAVEGAILPVRVVRAALGGKGPRLAAAADVPPGPPGLVARGPTPLDELLAASPYSHVFVDDPALLRPGRTLVRHAFDGREDAIDALADPALTLPGGLRATITPTPALVAIDLDTATGTVARAPKESVQLAANLAALPALARAIRLRNLSGAILIDPAGLSVRRRAKLGPALADALAGDPLRPRFLGVTALGLLEIVRPRRRPPLHELLAGPHAAGLRALRTIALEADSAPNVSWVLRCSPPIAAALDRDPVAKPELSRRLARSVIMVVDPTLPETGWLIESPV